MKRELRTLDSRLTTTETPTKLFINHPIEMLTLESLCALNVRNCDVFILCVLKFYTHIIYLLIVLRLFVFSTLNWQVILHDQYK